MTWHDELLIGVEHLQTHDPRIAELITQFPAPTFRPHTDYYRELVESIISQQLSVKAAATITRRFIDSFGHFPEPQEILDRDFEELRSVGLSGQKTNYIRDLAQKVLDGSVQFDHLDKVSNSDIIAELTAVKGIGEWTVHMFLIFCMGRFNVLATGDLGVRTGVMKLYGLDQLPSPADMMAIADRHNWRGYESIACWYVWKSLDNAPKL
jgi:DNA-3-methyladenine glycosylase II